MGRLRGMLLCLLLAAAVSTAPSPTPTASSAPTEPSPASTEPNPASTEPSPAFSYTQEATLNEMFREVEELMEDTQHKLRSAVEEVGEPAHQTPVSGGCGGAGQGGWGALGCIAGGSAGDSSLHSTLPSGARIWGSACPRELQAGPTRGLRRSLTTSLPVIAPTICHSL